MGTHIPVLLNEAIESLNIQDGKTYVDLTLGRAGHSSEILKRIPNGRLIAFDQDATAIEESRKRLEAIGSNFTLIRANFAEMKAKLEELGIEAVDGILADLGVSSPQLDDASRGFSYREDAPLDMRMNQDSPLTASIVVNTYSEKELLKILRDFGEEQDAYRIAKNIVASRAKKPIETTFELVEIVKASKSSKTLSKKGHPAKQTFQAIRMEVNQEEATLLQMLQDAPKLLAKGGRLAIIDFMSLDDRIVKNAFRDLTVVEGDRNNAFLRPEDIKTPDFKTVGKNPILPSKEELEANHRSAPAKMRVIERIR